jgi:hypothetical protein
MTTPSAGIDRTLAVPPTSAGAGVLKMFEASAEDGSEIHVVEGGPSGGSLQDHLRTVPLGYRLDVYACH